MGRTLARIAQTTSAPASSSATPSSPRFRVTSSFRYPYSHRIVGRGRGRQRDQQNFRVEWRQAKFRSTSREAHEYSPSASASSAASVDLSRVTCVQDRRHEGWVGCLATLEWSIDIIVDRYSPRKRSSGLSSPARPLRDGLGDACPQGRASEQVASRRMLSGGGLRHRSLRRSAEP